MSSEGLETLRSRYRAAYDAYKERASRIAQKLESGSTPTVEEVAAEAEATEELAIARRELLDAIVGGSPPLQ